MILFYKMLTKLGKDFVCDFYTLKDCIVCL